MTKAPAPAPDAPVMVCLMSFAGEGPGDLRNVVVSAGKRLRADHAIVQRWPMYWIADGSSDAERQAALQHRFPAPEPQAHIPLAKPAEPLPDELAMLCIRNVPWQSDGNVHIGLATAVVVGTRLHRNSPVVKSFSSHFVPVVAAGRTRANSVRAKQPNIDYRRDPASGEFIRETDPVLIQQFGEYKRFQKWWAGQWVEGTLADVAAHPDLLEVIT
jgi:hypothetical protein